MPLNIDLNAGVTMKRQAKDGKDVGPAVYMYKSRPGVYFNVFGNEVSEELAKEAGFDVEKLSRQRRQAELIEQAKKDIEAQLSDPDEKVVVKEREGVKVVKIGEGRYTIEGPDGSNILPPGVQYDEARAMGMLDKLVPEKAPAKKSAKEKAPKEADQE